MKCPTLANCPRFGTCRDAALRAHNPYRCRACNCGLDGGVRCECPTCACPRCAKQARSARAAP
jgi:hypothetical protein